MPTATYIALANVTLSTSDSSITFSSIPTNGTYRDLVVIITGNTTANADINIRLNGDSGANYSFIYVGGSGSGSGSTSSASGQTAIVLDAYFWRSTEISTCIAHIMDYSATDKHKTIISRNNVVGGGTDAFINRYASTSAISSLEVRNPAQSFASGTTITLFGIAS
jgi:hypothetical protein